MKRLHFIAVFAALALGIQAKTTYIPTYLNRIFLIEDGQIDSMQNHQQMLQIDSKDNLISCFVAQQAVSPDLVKVIKQAKRTAGWAAVASGLSSGAAGFSAGQFYTGRANKGAIVGYVESRETAKELEAMSADASAQAEELKTLMVDLVVKNNSEKEMLITDMDRGLVWFVLPGQETALPLAKGEECHFRISSCSPLDENVKYINVSADSSLEKYNVALETDAFWYVPISEKARSSLGFESSVDEGYIKIDKETRKMTALTPSEFKSIKAN